MLVLEYLLGACLQILGAFGGVWIIQSISKQDSNFNLKLGIKNFAIFSILEASLIGIFSFIYLTSPLCLHIWFYLKASFGLLLIIQHQNVIIAFVTREKLLSCLSLLLLISICVPTANFDCFSAHFAIPRLFIEHHGYPIRPDYQYLDALPLSGHMWYLPGMAAGLEGALNVISAIYCISIVLLLQAYHHRKIAFLGMLVLLSMPQWIRVSLDPMIDTPSCFFALYAWSLLHQLKRDKHLWSFFFFISCFLISLKPTLIVFPIMGFIVISRPLFTSKPSLRQLSILALAIICGGLWYFKNWFIHGNPLFPHLFGGSIAPNIPNDIIAVSSNASGTILDYILTILADHRWVLSYGPFPLMALPFLFLGLRHSKVRLLFLYLICGFLITWLFTSFKNRYFMPYLILTLPMIALWIARSPKWLTLFLKIQAVFTLLFFIPYFLQPFYAIFKNFDYHSYNTFKYPKYAVYHELNQSNARKVLLVGQPAYWITKPHQLAILSETHLDFTRLSTLVDLVQHLKNHSIDTLIYDRNDTMGMAEKKDPHYRKKAYQAQMCLNWMDKLLSSSHVHNVQEKQGMVVAKINFDQGAF